MATEKKTQVELLQPVTHDFVEYSRGLHELDDATAKSFLALKDGVSGKNVARVPETKEVAKGTTSEAADAPRRRGDPKTRD